MYMRYFYFTGVVGFEPPIGFCEARLFSLLRTFNSLVLPRRYFCVAFRVAWSQNSGLFAL